MLLRSRRYGRYLGGSATDSHPRDASPPTCVNDGQETQAVTRHVAEVIRAVEKTAAVSQLPSSPQPRARLSRLPFCHMHPAARLSIAMSGYHSIDALGGTRQHPNVLLDVTADGPLRWLSLLTCCILHRASRQDSIACLQLREICALATNWVR